MYVYIYIYIYLHIHTCTYTYDLKSGEYSGSRVWFVSPELEPKDPGTAFDLQSGGNFAGTEMFEDYFL